MYLESFKDIHYFYNACFFLNLLYLGFHNNFIPFFYFWLTKMLSLEIIWIYLNLSFLYYQFVLNNFAPLRLFLLYCRNVIQYHSIFFKIIWNIFACFICSNLQILYFIIKMIYFYFLSVCLSNCFFKIILLLFIG